MLIYYSPKNYVTDNMSNGGQADIDKGILNVTKSGYDAAGDGSTDVTTKLQKALKDARDARLVAFFPPGVYVVSDTLECIQSHIIVDNTDNALHQFELRAAEFPCVMSGTANGGAVICLKNCSPGFGYTRVNGICSSTPNTSDTPKPVIFFSSRMRVTPKAGTPCQVSDDTNPACFPIGSSVSFNHMITNIDVNLGNNNPMAIGIDHQGAQGSVIEDVRICAVVNSADCSGAALVTPNPFFAGIRGLTGSGGSIAKINITGGRYGIYAVKTGNTLNASLPSYPPAPRPANDQLNTNGSQPVPVASNIVLTNQTARAILYDGRGPLTLVGGVIPFRTIDVITLPPPPPTRDIR